MPTPSIAKTDAMRDVELRFDMPLERLIPRLFAEEGEIRLVARRLGISRTALWYWMRMLGIQRRTAVVTAEPAQPAA